MTLIHSSSFLRITFVADFTASVDVVDLITTKTGYTVPCCAASHEFCSFVLAPSSFTRSWITLSISFAGCGDLMQTTLYNQTWSLSAMRDCLPMVHTPFCQFSTTCAMEEVLGIQVQKERRVISREHSEKDFISHREVEKYQ